MSHEENKIAAGKRYKKSLAALKGYIEDMENYLDVAAMALHMAVEDIWINFPVVQKRNKTLEEFKAQCFSVWKEKALSHFDNREAARQPRRPEGEIADLKHELGLARLALLVAAEEHAMMENNFIATPLSAAVLLENWRLKAAAQIKEES